MTTCHIFVVSNSSNVRIHYDATQSADISTSLILNLESTIHGLRITIGGLQSTHIFSTVYPMILLTELIKCRTFLLSLLLVLFLLMELHLHPQYSFLHFKCFFRHSYSFSRESMF